MVALMSLAIMGASAAIVVDSSTGDNPGSRIDLNVNIDGSGSASTGSPWFNVSGSTSQSGAFGGTIGITIDGMKNASTNTATLGDELVDGDIDRDGAGYMGIVGAPNAGGIGADASNHEGLSFIIDEITGLDPVLAVKITGINVQNIGRMITDPSDESFSIVNLSTRDAITITPIADGVSAGTIDVSSLNLVAASGSTNPVASILSGDVGGFRVDGLTFEVVYTDDPSALLPPETVTATPTNSAQARLDWTAGQNATSYNIYRTTNSGSYGAALQTGLAGLTYTDTTVDNYTTYYYRITSVSNSVESIPSVEAFVTPYDTGDTTPPAAPSNFTADNPNGAWAVLDWDDNVEPDLDFYSVYRSTTSGIYGQPLVSNLTDSAYTDKDLLVGETYYYVIKATDFNGLQSSPSVEQSVTAAPLTGEKNVFFVLNSGEIYAFTSVVSNGITCLEQGHVTNGIAVATNPSYGFFQGFTSLPDGRIYGIDGSGDVIEWSDIDAWIGNVNPVIVSSGNYDPVVSAEVHGVSYDPNTEGFYTVQGSGTYQGDIGEYADEAALLANTPTTNYASGYNGNVCNFYYPLGDTPPAEYFQIAGGNGPLEGWQTLADYVSGPGAINFSIGGFSSGVTTVGAFALFVDIAPPATIGNVSIAHVGGQIVITAADTTDGMLYLLQSKSSLVSPPDWADVSGDLESIGGSVSVTTTPTQVTDFYRVRSKQ